MKGPLTEDNGAELAVGGEVPAPTNFTDSPAGTYPGGVLSYLSIGTDLV